MVEPPPTVEVVSQTEVYVVDKDGNRIKRICGYKTADETPCLNPAGHGTVHRDFGYCKVHDRKTKGGSKMWGLFAEEKGLPKNLGGLFQRAKELEDEDLSKMDGDIQLAYVLLADTLSPLKDNSNGKKNKEELDRRLTIAEKDHALRILRFISEAKRNKSTMEKEVKLDITTVKDFVVQIFKVIEQTVQGHKAADVMNAILSQVLLPLKAQKKIADAESVDFSDITPKALKDINESRRIQR